MPLVVGRSKTIWKMVFVVRLTEIGVAVILMLSAL